MTLADTSVWIEHLRRGGTSLGDLLNDAEVCIHPFVLGELACGTLVSRRTVLSLLGQLPQSPTATHDEALEFLTSHGLAGRGIGWVDVHLLASCALGGHRLLTLDRRLAQVARSFRLD